MGHGTPTPPCGAGTLPTPGDPALFLMVIARRTYLSVCRRFIHSASRSSSTLSDNEELRIQAGERYGGAHVHLIGVEWWARKLAPRHGPTSSGWCVGVRWNPPLYNGLNRRTGQHDHTFQWIVLWPCHLYGTVFLPFPSKFPLFWSFRRGGRILLLVFCPSDETALRLCDAPPASPVMSV